jgi:hypothetical protein
MFAWGSSNVCELERAGAASEPVKNFVCEAYHVATRGEGAYMPSKTSYASHTEIQILSHSILHASE